MLTEDMGTRVVTPEELAAMNHETRVAVSVIVRIMTQMRDLRTRMFTQH